MSLQAQKLYPYPFKIDDIEDVRKYLTNLYTALVEGDTDMTENLEYIFQDLWAFKTITGITNDVVADQKGDTLTLTATGGVLTIVGTAATDTITFDWTHLGIESLVDPNADRIMFWDDGETSAKWLAPNDFLTISGTNLNVDYVDEDDMVSNSATLLPTQQSVKAYIDNAIHSIIEQYLTDTADGDVATYLVMDNVETGQGESTVVLENMGTGDNQLIEEWVTPLGGLGAHTLVTGVYDLHIHAERTDGGRTVQLYWELWTRTSGGAETLRSTSEVTGAVTSKAAFDPHVVVGTDVDLNTTDRLVVKLYANVSATPANDTDITIYMEGTVESHLRMPTPFSTIGNIFVRHDLADAANDFLVASGADVFVKKTLAETGAILESDIQHDNLQGITAAEHIDWTNASDNFSTSGTLGCDDITANHLALGGVAINADYVIYLDRVLTDTDNSSKVGVFSQIQVVKTAAAMTNSARGFMGGVVLDSTNTQNWTNSLALRGVHGRVITEASSSGIVTGATAFVSFATIANAATVTNLYGFYMTTPSVAGNKVINEYGLYIGDQNTGLTLNYAIYTNAGDIRFGDLSGNAGHYVKVDADGKLYTEAS